MFGFEKLDTYKKAREFNLEIRKDILSNEKLDRVSKDQLRRAARSIMLNIAEGSSRFSKADERNFYVISRGSAIECVAILDLPDRQVGVKGKYKDVEGFCKSALLEEVAANNYVLTPGRYVGTEAEEDDGILFEDKMKVLVEKLNSQFKESSVLEKEIANSLKSIGYGI